MREPELDWPSANGSLIDMMAESGSNRNRGKDRSSASHSRSENPVSGVPVVLVVEDNESDIFLIREAISMANFPVVVQVVNDGEAAIRFFERADADTSIPCPAVVILDINLPKKQGGEVLKHMRQSHRCRQALVVVVSTSKSVQDREQMESLGANQYFSKPSDYDEFMRLGAIVKSLLADASLQ
jgi:two-component system, chemotaxis family, response regulator Rcp1